MSTDYGEALRQLERGWIQKKLWSPVGVCLVGALGYSDAEGIWRLSDQVVADLNWALNSWRDFRGLRDSGKYTNQRVFEAWNDSAGRKKEDVLRVVARMARRQRLRRWLELPGVKWESWNRTRSLAAQAAELDRLVRATRDLPGQTSPEPVTVVSATSTPKVTIPKVVIPPHITWGGRRSKDLVGSGQR